MKYNNNKKKWRKMTGRFWEDYTKFSKDLFEPIHGTGHKHPLFTNNKDRKRQKKTEKEIER